jgi:hypothetical protein
MYIFFHIIYTTLSLQSPGTFVSRRPICSLWYGNESASSSVSDVDRHVITRNLLDYTTLNHILHPLWERGCVIVSDVDRYVITRNWQLVFSTYFLCSHTGEKLGHTHTGLFFRKVVYTRYNVPSFIALMNFNLCVILFNDWNVTILVVSGKWWLNKQHIWMHFRWSEGKSES